MVLQNGQSWSIPERRRQILSRHGSLYAAVVYALPRRGASPSITAVLQPVITWIASVEFVGSRQRFFRNQAGPWRVGRWRRS